MNYYAFHIGDYTTNTAHLSPLEDIAYRRLLDLYYRTENPLGSSVEEIARMVRMSDHHVAGGFDAVKTVLREFFTESDTDSCEWRNKRCDAEIDAYLQMSKRNRKNGVNGGRPRKTHRVTTGLPVGSDRVTTGLPDETHSKPSHSPFPTTHSPLPRERETHAPFVNLTGNEDLKTVCERLTALRPEWKVYAPSSWLPVIQGCPTDVLTRAVNDFALAFDPIGCQKGPDSPRKVLASYIRNLQETPKGEFKSRFPG